MTNSMQRDGISNSGKTFKPADNENVKNAFVDGHWIPLDGWARSRLAGRRRGLGGADLRRGEEGRIIGIPIREVGVGVGVLGAEGIENDLILHRRHLREGDGRIRGLLPNPCRREDDGRRRRFRLLNNFDLPNLNILLLRLILIPRSSKVRMAGSQRIHP